MADEPSEALHRLEERLSRASEAAERLMAEAAKTSRRDRPPPAGWQAEAGPEDRAESRPSELEALIQAIVALRELIPPDVLERLVAALREVLLAIRALLDLSLERLELRAGDGAATGRQAQGGGLEDIPIQ